jgi:medium-chain acyl-[acyl-carrier-protein] hydrolase
MAAANAPHLPRSPRAELPEAEFIELLRRYEGTPAQVFAHKELLDMVLPTLRADFAIADTPGSSSPVRIPVSVYGGLEDPHASTGELERWRELTTESFLVRHFPGKHFFLRTAQDQVLAALREDLGRWAPGA